MNSGSGDAVKTGHADRALLLDPRLQLTVSVVSAWEIALKPELGIAEVAPWFREATRHLQARILPVRLEHIAAQENCRCAIAIRSVGW